jgi:hypothetical protein
VREGEGSLRVEQDGQGESKKAKERARWPSRMGLVLFQIWRRCWDGEQGDQEDQEGQRIADIYDRDDDFDRY